MGRRTAAGIAAAVLLALAACSRTPEPDGAAAWRRRGQDAEASGHPDSALVTYREAARRHPTEAWPWAGVGRACAALGRFGEASEAFRTAVRWDSTAVDERVALARIALEDGRATEALDWLDAAAAHVAEDAGRAAVRARALAAVGRHGEADAVLARAAAAAPSDPAVLGASARVKAAEGAVADALVAVDEAIALHPRNAALHEDRAAVLLGVTDTTGCLESLQRALDVEPRRPRARRLAAELLLATGRSDEAEPHLRRLLEDDPLDVAALDGLGAIALARGDREGARVALDRAIAIDPEFAPAYLALGRIEADAGRRDEAVTMLRKARARASRDPALWAECSVALAELYLRLGEAANAHEVAEAMLERDPHSVEGRTLRARALAAGGAGPTSGEELERLALDPAALPSELRAHARWLVDHGNAARALAGLDTLVVAHPEDLEARVLRAEALIALGKPDPARWALTAVVGEASPPAAAYRMLAALLLAEGRFGEAAQRAAEGEAIAPEDPELAHLHGEAARDAGDPDAARAAFQRERDLAPDRVEPWLALGDLELRAGLPDAALPWFEQARALDATDWRPWWWIARARAASGNPIGAIEACREALSRREDVAAVHSTLARLLADAGAPREDVAEHAARAVELDPRDTAARDLLRRARR